MLLTGGAHSDPADSAVVACLAGALPHARRYTFAGAGHVPHRTHPDELARVVRGFLDRVTAKA